jgi:predicted RNA-binding Zn-ribbon protein involved in translation (DUF1610 family)
MKCGVCGWHFSDRTLVKHSETACGEESIKAESKPFTYCDSCGSGLAFKQWRYFSSNGVYLCEQCNEERQHNV